MPDQAPILDDAWQEWNALSGAWARRNLDGAGAAPPSGANERAPQTIASIVASSPNAVILGGADGLGGMQIAAGFGGPTVSAGFLANVDALIIGFDSGPTYTYDFEPAPTP